MLETDARRLAAAIEERAQGEVTGGEGITATDTTNRTVPSSVPAGAGRPAFIRYYIRIDDGSRAATLGLDQASLLLEDIQPDWDPDQLFSAIQSRGARIEDLS